jgi:hypothetical protein
LLIFNFKQGDKSIDHDAIEASVAPRLVRAGHVGDVKPLYIAREGKILMKSNSSITIENALAHLVSCYIKCSILPEYPVSTVKQKFIPVFGSCDDAENQGSSERVPINKYLQELE